ncbi:hypothetical protein [Lactiplantibacillus plantarum]|uniref:hypothetical protein n=1 Tax=Lactiplantibacillus plantarum TaxID=1590 RepID=UPI0007BB071C|nr:hypothetical protein [Lactiplantibacillus plantarum]KZT77713.1 hypothetical protein Nizo1838_2611 [Lactiplantibacillus plantarum]KZT86361.1 hypothetical protein Nizo2256_2736 [Lactiplantibacillus plantarum]
MMTGMIVLFVLLVGLVLSGIFFRYMDTTAGISFSSLKFADLRMELLNLVLVIGLLLWALVLIR